MTSMLSVSTRLRAPMKARTLFLLSSLAGVAGFALSNSEWIAPSAAKQGWDMLGVIPSSLGLMLFVIGLVLSAQKHPQDSQWRQSHIWLWVALFVIVSSYIGAFVG